MWTHTPDHSVIFYEAVDNIATYLECPKIDLLGAANAESGVSARAQNPRSSATGLLQWMEMHWAKWGYTREQFAALPADVQVQYVQRYLKPYRGRLPNAAAIYTAIFLPAYVTQASDLDYVLCARKGHPEERLAWAFAANAVFDRNGDGRITVRELLEAIQRNWSGARCREMLVRANVQRADAAWLLEAAANDLGTTIGIQNALLALGYDLGRWGADGVAGEVTRRALVAFQKSRGLVADGIPGPKTRAALLAA